MRPIGIGEVPRQIISKAVLSLFSLDVQDAAGPLQVCAGQDGGCEAAVHAMRQFYTEQEVHGALSKSICPPLHQILVNTYRVPIRCIICGDGEITSSEGTLKGIR